MKTTLSKFCLLIGLLLSSLNATILNDEDMEIKIVSNEDLTSIYKNKDKSNILIDIDCSNFRINNFLGIEYRDGSDDITGHFNIAKLIWTTCGEKGGVQAIKYSDIEDLAKTTENIEIAIHLKFSSFYPNPTKIKGDFIILYDTQYSGIKYNLFNNKDFVILPIRSMDNTEFEIIYKKIDTNFCPKYKFCRTAPEKITLLSSTYNNITKELENIKFNSDILDSKPSFTNTYDINENIECIENRVFYKKYHNDTSEARYCGWKVIKKSQAQN